MKLKIKQKLKKYFKNNNYITIYSNIDNDEETYQGYVTKISDDFICLLIIEDWHADGYIILPIKYISEIRYSKYEKTYHKILKKENALKNISQLKWLDINNFHLIFKSLKLNENNVIIESRLSSVDEFVIGKIKAIKEKKLHFIGFDSTAKWIKGKFKIPYNEITLIIFNDEYSKVFRKYVK